MAERIPVRRQLRRRARPVLRVARRVFFAAYRVRDRVAAPRDAVRDDSVRILLFNAFTAGGTNRAVFTWAEELARTFDVEIVSLLREADNPFYNVPAGVRLSVLADRRRPPRGRVPRLLSRLPALLWDDAEGSYGTIDLLVDLKLLRWIRRQRSGVVVATRIATNILLAELHAPGVCAMGQQHIEIQAQHSSLQAAVARSYGRLDVLVVLTRPDEADFTAILGSGGPHVVRIPNAVRRLTGTPATCDSRVAIAFGEFRSDKGFDLLVQAWAQVNARHPEWTLRIFGDGPERAPVAGLVRDLGLQGAVELPGPSGSIGDELAQASVFALSSRSEGFSLALIEAMSKGLAVVSFACRGPSEIITHGRDGLLVPPLDVNGLAAGLLQVIEDEDLRGDYQREAQRSARSYDLTVIAAQWSELFLSLTGGPQ